MGIKEFKCSDKIILPSGGETVAIAHKGKTAALCYNRIWSPLYEEVPNSIRCFGGSREELAWVRILSDMDSAAKKLMSMLEKADTVKKKLEVFDEALSPVFSFSSALSLLLTAVKYQRQLLGVENTSDISIDQLVKMFPGAIKFLKDNPEELKKFAFDNIDLFFGYACRKISKSFYKKHGIPMIPIYGSVKERDTQYNEGDRKAVVIALSNIKVVDEDNLIWEQVLEFRADKEIQQKYKRFLHWLDEKMVGKSQAFVEDDISIRLKDYEQALKKHGIKTVVGEVSEVIAGGGLIGLADPKLGFLTAGALVAGKVIVKVAKILLDFDDVERGQNSEISWVYEVKKLGR